MNKYLALLLSLVFFIFLSCSKRIATEIEKEIPVYSSNSSYHNKLLQDSVYVYDSVCIYINNDTFFKYKEKVRYKYIVKKDTVIVIDSVPYTITQKIKEIEKVNELKKWQKVLMGIGILFLILVFIYITYKLIKIR